MSQLRPSKLATVSTESESGADSVNTKESLETDENEKMPISFGSDKEQHIDQCKELPEFTKNVYEEMNARGTLDENERNKENVNTDVMFLKVDEQLNLVKEENNKLSLDINELEKERTKLSGTIRLLENDIAKSDLEIIDKKFEIQILKREIERKNQNERMERKISEVKNELESLNFKRYQMVSTIEQINIDISHKDEIISEISNKLKSKEDELKYFFEYCMHLERRYGIIEENLKELRKVLTLNRKELLLCEDELFSLRLSLKKFLRKEVEEKDSNLEVFEREAFKKNNELISVNSKCKNLILRNEHLFKQEVEYKAFFQEEKIKNLNLLDEIKLLRETQERNSEESKSIIDNLTEKNKKLLARRIKQDKYLKDIQAPEMDFEKKILDTKVKTTDEEDVEDYEEEKVENFEEELDTIINLAIESGLALPEDFS